MTEIPRIIARPMIYIKQNYSYFFEFYSKNDQGMFANLAFLKSSYLPAQLISLLESPI